MILEAGGIWSEAELAALAPPERLTPSQWGERYRQLNSYNNAVPKYSLDLTPYRTPEVLDFCRRDPHKLRVVFGRETKTIQVPPRPVLNDGVVCYTAHSEYYKDKLASYRAMTDKWLVNDAIDDVYCEHQCAERKVLVRRNGKLEARWVPYRSRPNHLFDAEYYQMVAADLLQVATIPPEEALIAERQKAERVGQAPRQRRDERQRSWSECSFAGRR